MSAKVLEEMNAQIRQELESAYLYFSMAAYFEHENLPGFAHWMRAQCREETEHAMAFFGFLSDVGERVRLDALAQPRADFASPLEAFEAALEHERFISSCIHALCDLAEREKNHPAREFLQRFVKEQVEEEKSAGAIVARLRRAGDSGPALLMLDAELGRRAGEED